LSSFMFSSEKRPKKEQEDVIHDRYPFWWNWTAVRRCGCVIFFRSHPEVKTVLDSVVEQPSNVELRWVDPGARMPFKPAKPEALGGVHIELEPNGCVEGPYHGSGIRRFTWELFPHLDFYNDTVVTQAYTRHTSTSAPTLHWSRAGPETQSYPLPLDFYEFEGGYSEPRSAVRGLSQWELYWSNTRHGSFNYDTLVQLEFNRRFLDDVPDPDTQTPDESEDEDCIIGEAEPYVSANVGRMRGVLDPDDP